MIVAHLMLSFVFFAIPVLAQSSEPAPAQNAPAQAVTPTVQSQAGTPTVPPDSTQLEIVKRQIASYPLAAQSEGIQGQVWIQFLISEKGDVEKAEVISGDPVLAQSALNAAKKWKFKPYIKNGKAIKVSTKLPFNFAFSDKVKEERVSTDGKQTTGISSQPVTTGTDKASNSCKSDNPLPTRIRVSQGVSEGMLVHRVTPMYPAQARTYHVQGSVILQAVIGKDGLIHDLKVVSGPPELCDAAVGAVQQWRYRPYLLKGEPVEVETQIQVNFTLR